MASQYYKQTTKKSQEKDLARGKWGVRKGRKNNYEYYRMNFTENESAIKINLIMVVGEIGWDGAVEVLGQLDRVVDRVANPRPGCKQRPRHQNYPAK